MALIYSERWDVSSTITQIMAGTHVFHKEAYPPLRDRGILICGISDGDEPFEVDCIDAPWHVLVFCLGGSGEIFTSDGQNRTLNAGQLALMPQGVHSGYRRTGTTAMPHVWFFLYQHARWDYLNQVQPSILASVEGCALQDMLRQFHRETQRFNAGDPACLVVQALDCLCLTFERAIKPFHPCRGWPEQLQQMFAYVQKNINQDWDNAALAAQLHITTAHLHRLCSQHLQETPNKIVFRMKMNQAKELLMHGNRVGDVALLSGYQEAASFSRRFRQYFGYNPSQVCSKYAVSRRG